MVTPKKFNTPGWNLSRYLASAGCLFALVVSPTSIGGDTDSFAGPDGRRLFSNVRDSALASLSSPTLPKSGVPSRTRRKAQPPAGIGRLIDRIAGKHRMDPERVEVVARVEFNYNPTAIFPKGVMQLLPEPPERFGVADAYDSAHNIADEVPILKFLRNPIPDNLFSFAPMNPQDWDWPIRLRQSPVPGETIRLFPVSNHLHFLRESTLSRHPVPVPMVTPTKINTPGWNLDRTMASAVCLFTLFVCPTPVGGQIDSITEPDGRRIFSNTRNTATAPPSSPTRPKPDAPPRTRRRGQPPAGIGRLIDRIARKHGMDPGLVRAVARVESNYNPTAISPKGALGVMQLLPETAKRFGVADAYDPAQNIEGGVRYLKFLRKSFPGNLSLMLAAYNAGENAVRRHGGIPPYRETRNYVHKIRQLYARDLPDTAPGGLKPEIVSYRDSAGRLVYSNLESSYR